MSAKQKLVLVGNGMAGSKLLEELALNQQADQMLFDISVFGDEPQGSYNRIMLSPVLAGEMAPEEIKLLADDWYDQHNIKHYFGEAGDVLAINRATKTLICANGHEHHYDRLVIATGSKPFMLPLPGAELAGVMSFRDLYDVERMITASQNGQHAIVIGAGLLGLEAAVGLAERGMKVTVINQAGFILNRQLDFEAAAMLQQQLEAKGLSFELGADTKQINSEDGAKVSSVTLGDGKQLKADLVVMAIGVRPNIALAQDAGLHCERGIVVNDVMQTFDPSVYALGECVQHRGDTFGLVAPLYDQAKVLANQLCQHGVAQYRTLPSATKLKVTGVNVFSVGDFEGDDNCEYLFYRDPAQATYKKLVLRNERLIGAVLTGDTVDGPFYQGLVESQTNIHAIRSCLLFGQALCELQSPNINDKAANPAHEQEAAA